MDNPRTRIHEAEWILEATARYVPLPEADGAAATAPEVGHDDLLHDNAQGYGIVDVHRAVTVALALEKLRRDNPERAVTVADALRAVESGRQYFQPEVVGTDRVHASWEGEYSRYTDLGGGSLSSVNQTKLLFVPPGTTQLDFTLNYVALDTQRLTFGDLTYAVDWNRDGTNEVTGSLSPLPPGGNKEGTVPVPGDRAGTVVAINVVGNGFKLQRPLQDHNYAEWRAHYSMGVTALVELPQGNAVAVVDKGNVSSMLAPWSASDPSESYAQGSVAINTSYIDIRGVTLAPLPPPPGGGVSLPFGGALLVLLLVGAGAVYALARVQSVRARAARFPVGSQAVRLADRTMEAAQRVVAGVRRLVARAGVSPK
jgi:hypothetical protein